MEKHKSPRAPHRYPGPQGEDATAGTMMVDVPATTGGAAATDEEKPHQEHKAPTDTDVDSVVTYIDFVPPPPPPVPPPAKYKLWLLILVVVYFGRLLANEANVVDALTFHGWLSPQAALFVFMLLQVSVATYAALDLLVRAFTIKITTGNKVYGLEAWLKMGRAHVWLQNKFQHNDNKRHAGNFLTDLLICLVQILEEGFEIFNPTDCLEQHKVSQEFQKNKCKNESSCHVVLKIEHSVKGEYTEKYEEWKDKIGRRAATQPGFVGLVREPKDRSVADGNDDDECQEQRTHIVYLTFENVQTLNDWMTSPIRQKLVDELTPWLDSDNVVQLVANRRLPDAWTDLLVRQGEFVPPRPPPKWKVMWLTTCGLFLSVLILNRILPYYYEQWGIVDANERLVAFLDALFATFFVSYIMQPLMIMQFSHWLQRKQPKPGEDREPWRTLNDGIESIWIKLFITVAFFGSMGIKWAMTVYKD